MRHRSTVRSAKTSGLVLTALALVASSLTQLAAPAANAATPEYLPHREV